MPSFFHRIHGVSMERADSVFGGVTVISGFLGTAVGGWAGDVAVKRHPGGYLWISGVGLLVGAPLVLLVAVAPQVDLAYALALVAMFFLFFNTGPINAELVNCVAPNLRSSAVALNVLCIHLLGDALSPPLIGTISEHFGIRAAVAMNAVPLVLGGLLLLIGSRKVVAPHRA